MTNDIIWKGSPSQITNIHIYAIWLVVTICSITLLLIDPRWFAEYKNVGLYALTAIMAFFSVIALRSWLLCAYTKYQLSSQQLFLISGIFLVNQNPVELYRVQDYKASQPLWCKLFSLGNITLYTSDQSHPIVELVAIPNHTNLAFQVRDLVEKCKIDKKVRVLDIE